MKKLLIIFLCIMTQLYARAQGFKQDIIKHDTALNVPYPALIDVNKNLIMLINYGGKRKQPAVIKPVVAKDGSKYDLPPMTNYSTATTGSGSITTPYRTPIQTFSLSDPDPSDSGFIDKSFRYVPDPIDMGTTKKDTVSKPKPPRIVFATKTNIPGLWQMISGTGCWLASGTCFVIGASRHYDFIDLTNINVIQYKNNQQIIQTSNRNNIVDELRKEEKARRGWYIAGGSFAIVGTALNTWGICKQLGIQFVTSPDGISVIKRF